MKKTEVTIILCTYNPDLKKLMASVKAAVCQKGIAFEIIISDDGSNNDYFRELNQYFNRVHFDDYLFIKNHKNVGTVKNILGALKHANGEYVFYNSPGDYIFDSKSMADFYHFAKSKNADICFGNYIPYSFDGKEVKYSDYCKPKNVKVYNYHFNNYKALFLTDDGIVGASYFRSRKFAMDSMQYIVNHSNFVEDGTTTAYGLANNIHVYFYNRSIVWYEYGYGISTNNSSKWAKRIHDDFVNTFNVLINDYPKDHYLKAALFYLEDTDKRFWKIKFFLRFPIIFLTKIRFKKMADRKLSVNKEEENYLLSLIKDNERELCSLEKYN